MPAFIAALGELLVALWRPIASWFVRMLASAGVLTGVTAIMDWITKWAAKTVYEGAITGAVVVAGLATWAVVIAAFWNWVSGNGLREIFSSDPLSGIPGGMLYLASYAFPFKFFFGMASAYITWKATYIQVAIIQSRLVKALFGF